MNIIVAKPKVFRDWHENLPQSILFTYRFSAILRICFQTQIYLKIVFSLQVPLFPEAAHSASMPVHITGGFPRPMIYQM